MGPTPPEETLHTYIYIYTIALHLQISHFS